MPHENPEGDAAFAAWTLEELDDEKVKMKV
jgi:hypothetical protein